jgi:hypothetical protein
MSYQRERDAFIARMSSEGLPLDVITKLLAAATTLNRYVKLACSSESADRDRVPCPRGDRHGRMTSLARKGSTECLCDYDHSNPDAPHQTVPRFRVREANVERRIKRVTELVPGWSVRFQGDPRGYVLRVIPPSYAERNAGRDRSNLDTIGVPARESGLRF